MAIEQIPLTTEQFELLRAWDDWKIDAVPPEHWPKIPGLQRLKDTFAVFASGTINSPTNLNKVANVIAGLDVLTVETNRKPNEPEGNAYHYVFQETRNPEFPYLMHGPFCSETIVEHWFDASQLERYWNPSV